MVSVLLAVLNGEEFIAYQLEALRNQTYQFDWELIIIDNGSEDNTIKIVNEYQSKLPSITLLHYTERKGKGYCCNYAVKFAKGDILAFCDADDVVFPSWLEAIVEGIAQTDVVTGPLILEEINEMPLQWRRTGAMNTTLRKALDFLPFVPGCNFGIRRQTFQEIGGFSPSFKYQQDLELSWRLQLEGYNLMFVPEAAVHYRYRDSFYRSWKQLSNYADAHVKLYKNYKEHGMPPSSSRIVLKRYVWLIKKAPLFVAVVLSKKTYPLQSRWVHQAALSWGRLRGTLKYKTLYL